MTSADVDAAFAALATSLNADRGAGKDREPLHWSGNFIAAAIAANSASQAKVDALCQAYYGIAPPIQMRTRAREGTPIAFVVNVHEPWNIDTLQRCWAITSITADGTTKLSPREEYNQHEPVTPEAISGTGRDGERHLELPNTLSPGEHELAFAYECGIVSENATFRGIDGKPGQPDKWPRTISRWQTIVKRKVVISPKDQSPLTIITDPSRDPLSASPIGVQEALVRPATKGIEIVIKWTFPQNATPVLSYRVQLQVGGQRIDYGTLVIGSYSNGRVESISPGKRLASLPPDVRSMDITLTPDPTPAERFIDIEEVWGRPLELKDVPLSRFDVEGAK